MKKYTSAIIVISFFAVIFGISYSFIFQTNDSNISCSSNLSLSSPEMFSETIETYFSENLFCKKFLRFLKANVAYNILFQVENNGLIIKEGSITKTDEQKDDVLKHSFDIFERISSDFCSKKVIAILPSKNEYFFESCVLFRFYDNILDKIKTEFNTEFEIIDSKNTFNLTSFFNTDHHIKQPSMLSLKNQITQELCSGVSVEEPKKIKTATNSFVGVFGVQSAIPVCKDCLEYIESPTINNANVKVFNNGNFEDGKVYHEEYKNEYNFFFGGNKGIIKINNMNIDKKDSGRLVIFRDSYASALAPLLIEDFSEIILIDLRIIDYEKAIDIVGKEGNVLLLYGTQSICCDGISR